MNSERTQQERSRLKREILAVVGGVMVAGCAALVAMPRTHGVSTITPHAAGPAEAAQAGAGDVERTEAKPVAAARSSMPQPAAPDNAAVIIKTATIEPAQAVRVSATLPGSGDNPNTPAAGEPVPLVLGRSVVMSYFVTMKSPPTCPADMDDSGAIDVDDFEQFISDYYAAEPSTKADFDHDGRFTVDDVAAYVQAYFGGCDEGESTGTMEFRCENAQEMEISGMVEIIASRIEADIRPQAHLFAMPAEAQVILEAR